MPEIKVRARSDLLQIRGPHQADSRSPVAGQSANSYLLRARCVAHPVPGCGGESRADLLAESFWRECVFPGREPKGGQLKNWAWVGVSALEKMKLHSEAEGFPIFTRFAAHSISPH